MTWESETWHELNYNLYLVFQTFGPFVAFSEFVHDPFH
jgi:hypothetical protein